MNKQQAFDVLSASSIPFAMGQSSIYGCDCVGLIVLYYEFQNLKFPVENIRRRVMDEGRFLETAKVLGLKPSVEGDLVIFQDQRTGHCGITDGRRVIHQHTTQGTQTSLYRKEMQRFSWGKIRNKKED